MQKGVLRNKIHIVVWICVVPYRQAAIYIFPTGIVETMNSSKVLSPGDYLSIRLVQLNSLAIHIDRRLCNVPHPIKYAILKILTSVAKLSN